MTRLAALEAAVAAAERQDWAAVLRALERAWAVDKHPSLADLAWALVRERLSFAPVAERLERETEASWHACFERGEVSRLVSTPWPRLTSFARARVEAIVSGEPSLLWTASLAHFVRTDPYRSGQSVTMTRKIIRWLARHGDPMSRQLIEAIRAAETGPFRVDLGAVERRPLPVVVPFSEQEARQHATLARLLARGGRDLEALFSAVFAAPFDDAPRAVLADALTEAGDVRGEFISLQLEGSKRHARRVRELLRSHGAHWLAPLSPFIEVPAGAEDTFSRGFPASVRLRAGQGSECFGRTGAWGTIERLRVEASTSFQFHPNLRALRQLEGVGDAGTVELPPLERLFTFDEVPVSKLPVSSVRELGLYSRADRPDEALAALAGFQRRARWFDTVRALVLPGAVERLELGLELLHRFPKVEVVRFSSELLNPRFPFEAGWDLRLLRGGRLEFTWHGRSWDGPPPAAIAMMLTPRRVQPFSTVVVSGARLSSAQRAAVVSELRAVAFDWPESVSLELFGADGRSDE